MQSMFAGYMWLGYRDRFGGRSSYTVRWDRPRFTIADASLFSVSQIAFQALDAPLAELIDANAWVMSVTVRDPSTGQEFVRASNGLEAVRIEDNAVAVTYALTSSANTEAQGLVHAFWWT
jgi:hypothetical protein